VDSVKATAGWAHDADNIGRVLLRAFHRPLRVATAVLALAGVCLATAGVIAALTHHDTGQAVIFTIIAVVLASASALLFRGHRWAIVIAVITLCGQGGAVAARIWELIYGIDPIKTRQLQHLGFNPTTGVIINLIYSSVGAILFAWFAVRYITLRRNAG
jgi:drug/metabolite transporter (DMT)-like permease